MGYIQECVAGSHFASQLQQDFQDLLAVINETGLNPSRLGVRELVYSLARIVGCASLVRRATSISTTTTRSAECSASMSKVNEEKEKNEFVVDTFLRCEDLKCG